MPTSSKTDSIKITQEIYKKNLELLQDRRHTEQLLYSVSDIVFAVNLDHKITLINHAATNYLNIESENVVNTDVDTVIKLKYEKGQNITSTDYAFQLEASKSKIDGLVLETPYGDMYVNLRTSIITSEEKFSECVVTLSDVTKERMLDKAKDEFVNIASHELRSPLTIIKSYLWMLTNHKAGELNEKQTMYLEKATRGTERMLALVNDYLNIARIEQGRITLNIELVDYTQLIEEIYDEFKLKADEKKLWIKVETDPDLPKIYADKSRLREILVNLVSNAVKYTQSGGVLVKAYRDDKFVRVDVKDTGRGIKDEDIKKLFTKFGRLESNFSNVAEEGGTGLGLYITKSLVEKMGGAIGVESEGLGKGSIFWFTLLNEYSKDTVSSIVI
jgi:signal transduction histidine kinase